MRGAGLTRLCAMLTHACFPSCSASRSLVDSLSQLGCCSLSKRLSCLFLGRKSLACSKRWRLLRPNQKAPTRISARQLHTPTAPSCVGRGIVRDGVQLSGRRQVNRVLPAIRQAVHDRGVDDGRSFQASRPGEWPLRDSTSRIGRFKTG